MKKRWKIFSIVCVSIAGIGILLCIAGFAAGAADYSVREAFRNGLGRLGFFSAITDWEEDTSAEVERITEMFPGEGSGGEVFTGIRKIEVDVTSIQVSVMETEEEEVMIDADVVEKLDFRCYQEGDTLKLETESDRYIKGNEGGTLVIYVPAGMKFEEADFSVGAGILEVDRITARELDLEAGAGLVEVAAFDADELSVSCGAGAVSIDGNAAQKADVECGMGAVEWTTEGTESDFNYKMEVGMGSVKIGSGDFSGLAVEKTIHNNAAKEMEIECGMGDVDIIFEGV